MITVWVFVALFIFLFFLHLARTIHNESVVYFSFANANQTCEYLESFQLPTAAIESVAQVKQNFQEKLGIHKEKRTHLFAVQREVILRKRSEHGIAVSATQWHQIKMENLIIKEERKKNIR